MSFMNIENLLWVNLDTQMTIPKALKPWLIDNHYGSTGVHNKVHN
jgi:hypothetical protein